MSVHIHLEGYGRLSFINGIPPHYTGYVLSQAVAQHATGPWGTLCVQEIRTEKYLLRHFLFSIVDSISFYIREQEKLVQCLLSLSGMYDYRVNGLKPIQLKEKEYILLHAGSEKIVTTAYGGKIGSLVSTYYTPESYRELLPLFPRFKRDLKKALGRPILFVYPPKVARYTVHDSILAIWFDKYLDALQLKHIELRLESSLFTLLAQGYSQQASEPLSRFEREKAEAARDLMLENIKVHQTPEQIAQALYCSVGWLKKAFSKAYGTGLFHFLRKTRMERAKEMLLRGDSLKAVALEVGMKPRNFPKEFKAHFGYTVTALKKGMV